MLFSGSVRSNIDPFDSHSDPELWAALGVVALKDYVKSLGGSGFMARIITARRMQLVSLCFTRTARLPTERATDRAVSLRTSRDSCHSTASIKVCLPFQAPHDSPMSL